MSALGQQQPVVSVSRERLLSSANQSLDNNFSRAGI